MKMIVYWLINIFIKKRFSVSMREGYVLVDQVLDNGDIIQGCDYSLSTAEMFERLQRYFPNLKKDSNGFIHGNYEGFKYSIRAKNITYLGNPHPGYKKRIQISEDLQHFYRYSKSLGCEPFLIGIYTFGTTQVFVNFSIKDYIEKKANNSSAHVYVSDISAGVIDKIFQKTDYFNNTITVFRHDCVRFFFDDYLNREKKEDDLFGDCNESVDFSFEERQTLGAISCEVYPTIMPSYTIFSIMKFFHEEKRVWHGIDCYKEMISAHYRNKFQPEWAGFYLEYEFEKYLRENNLNNKVKFAQYKTKRGIDLDLFFPDISCYGDLKSHSSSSDGIQGNDRATVIQRIKMDGHVFYIVCTHDTFKDSQFDYEVTKYWNNIQSKENPMSYSTRMKHHIVLKEVCILDINGANFQNLSIFRQGINSNGKLRDPKVMVSKEKLMNFVVARMLLES